MGHESCDRHRTTNSIGPRDQEMSEMEEEWPELEVPAGCVDVLCKFCKRSKYTHRNTLVGLAEAKAKNQLTLRWRRERGAICASCVNFQASKQTAEKFRTHNVFCLHVQVCVAPLESQSCQNRR